MRFQYLRDPLFLAVLAVYFVNRWVFKSVWSGGFVHEHLNDLICIPFWVPIMLWGTAPARVSRVRRTTAHERDPDPSVRLVVVLRDDPAGDPPGGRPIRLGFPGHSLLRARGGDGGLFWRRWYREPTSRGSTFGSSGQCV